MPKCNFNLININYLLAPYTKASITLIDCSASIAEQGFTPLPKK